MGDLATIENAEKAVDALPAALSAVQAQPLAFLLVMVGIAFLLCFLPGGVLKAWIEHRTEMRKLDERTQISRKKLTSKGQKR